MAEKRLLVVDDRPELGEVVRRAAESIGYEVKVTVHANEFMRVFEEFDPTVVVLDIVMPDIDGIELVKWLYERGTDAKVFVTTAFNSHYAQMAEALGEAKGLDVSFIKKPFRITELREALS
jgi:DNA-binding response OmpR family regulator